MYRNLIKSKKNKSALKTDEFIQSLPLNQQMADLQDYGRVRSQVFQEANKRLAEQDSLPNVLYGTSRNTT